MQSGRGASPTWDDEAVGPYGYRDRIHAPGRGGYLPRRLVPIPADDENERLRDQVLQAVISASTGVEGWSGKYDATWGRVADAVMAVLPDPGPALPDGCEVVVLPSEAVIQLTRSSFPSIAAAARDAIARRPKPAHRVDALQAIRGRLTATNHQGDPFPCLAIERDVHGLYVRGAEQNDGWQRIWSDGTVEVLVDGES